MDTTQSYTCCIASSFFFFTVFCKLLVIVHSKMGVVYSTTVVTRFSIATSYSVCPWL